MRRAVFAFGLGGALAVGGASLQVPVARAFQDPGRFGSPTTEAGGGGRYFTGSPADGYGCGVCHSGYRVPLQIAGIPDGLYVPGRAYRIDITWPAGLPPAGLNAEVTDGLGRAVGELSVPPPEQLTEADFCEPVELGTPAAGVLPVEGASPDAPRQMGIAFACGAKRTSFVWTAPAVDAGPVWFAGGLVVSDEKGTVDGDGLAEFAKLLGSPAQPDPLAASITGEKTDCAVGRPGSRSGDGPGWTGYVAAWLALCLVSRRRRRS